MKLLTNSIAFFLFFITVLLPASVAGQITATLNGGSHIQHQVRTPYTEPGVTAKDANGNVISASMQLITGAIDVNILGTYNLSYIVTPGAVIASQTGGGSNQTTVIRTVTVVDNVECMLQSVPGTESLVVDVYDISFIEPSVTATDNYYPSVSVTRNGSFDISKLGTYVINYKGIDGSGNTCTYERTIKVVDREKPQVSCNPVTIDVNTTFDPMANVLVSDNYFTPSGCTLEVISNNVDPSLPGIYQVCYQATDGEGNVSEPCCATVTVTSQTMGIAEDTGVYFDLYPNPSTGNFDITLNRNQEPVTIQITTITGQTIKTYTEKDITNGKITADLTGEAAGIYFVQITNASNAGTKKLVLSK